jgi:hypothetical protein
VKRREFITLVGVVAGLPVAAHAQQPDRMRRIAVLMGFPESEPASTELYRGIPGRTSKARVDGWAQCPD